MCNNFDNRCVSFCMGGMGRHKNHFPTNYTLATHEWRRTSSFERYKIEREREDYGKPEQTEEQLKERWEFEKAFVLDTERRDGKQQFLWAMMCGCLS